VPAVFGQDVQPDAPPEEYVATAQLAQAVAFAAEEYRPAAHSAHWVPPVVSLNLPAAHSLHAEAAAAE